MKPYYGGNDLLYAVHEMDIGDKHRDLIVAGHIVPSLHGTFKVGSPTRQTFDMPIDIFKALENGEPILTFEAGSQVEYDFQIAVDVAFKEIAGVQKYSAIDVYKRQAHGLDFNLLAFGEVHKEPWDEKDQTREVCT